MINPLAYYPAEEEFQYANLGNALAMPMMLGIGGGNAMVPISAPLPTANNLANYTPNPADYPLGTPVAGPPGPTTWHDMAAANEMAGAVPPDPTGVFANMTPEALRAWSQLEAVRPGLGLHLTSLYRDPATNANVGGANRSEHMNGNAFDMSIPGMSIADTIALIQDARRAGFTGIGVYGPGTVHFDVGPPRAWGPSYGADTIPGWARPYVP